MKLTIVAAECGCRFKVVSALPIFTQAILELESICVPHSQERTKWLAAEPKPIPPPGHMEMRMGGTHCPLRAGTCKEHSEPGNYHFGGKRCEGLWHRLMCGGG